MFDNQSRPAAGLLMNYSRGCEAVLGLMGPLSLSAPSSPTSNGCSSGSDGYHSDSDTDETKYLPQRLTPLQSQIPTHNYIFLHILKCSQSQNLPRVLIGHLNRNDRLAGEASLTV